MVLHRQMCIVFFAKPPIAISNLPYCSDRYNLPKILVLVSWAKIQYARDGEGL
jgi:hypothetical protein